MNYEEALEYIHTNNWTFCKPGLERTAELCARLGNPEKNLKFIHVAGTNGKGSFCSMLDSVLRQAGYKTGLYTSPYIKEFNERMRVCGENISNERLAELPARVKPIADSMTDKPTEFELITAIAFLYFFEKKCDVVILEAGMGGRLDSTNVIREPLLSVITGIALDHTAFLGDTTEKIAAEKAGIIKDKSPVLFGGTDIKAKEVIERKARMGASAYYEADYSRLNVNNASLSGCNFDYKTRHGVDISLLGLYQPRNASLVLDAIDILNTRGLSVGEEDIRAGLLNAKWPARFEILSKEPLIIFDGAHNPEGITSAVKSIKHYFGEEKVYILSGILSDKDYHFIAGKLCEVAEKIFTLTPDNPRALSAEEYAKVIRSHSVYAEAHPNIEDAFNAARVAALADGKPLICLGSLYTYCDIINYI